MLIATLLLNTAYTATASDPFASMDALAEQLDQNRKDQAHQIQDEALFQRENLERNSLGTAYSNEHDEFQHHFQNQRGIIKLKDDLKTEENRVRTSLASQYVEEMRALFQTYIAHMQSYRNLAAQREIARERDVEFPLFPLTHYEGGLPEAIRKGDVFASSEAQDFRNIEDFSSAIAPFNGDLEAAENNEEIHAKALALIDQENLPALCYLSAKGYTFDGNILVEVMQTTSNEGMFIWALSMYQKLKVTSANCLGALVPQLLMTLTNEATEFKIKALADSGFDFSHYPQLLEKCIEDKRNQSWISKVQQAHNTAITDKAMIAALNLLGREPDSSALLFDLISRGGNVHCPVNVHHIACLQSNDTWGKVEPLLDILIKRQSCRFHSMLNLVRALRQRECVTGERVNCSSLTAEDVVPVRVEANRECKKVYQQPFDHELADFVLCRLQRPVKHQFYPELVADMTRHRLPGLVRSFGVTSHILRTRYEFSHHIIVWIRQFYLHLSEEIALCKITPFENDVIAGIPDENDQDAMKVIATRRTRTHNKEVLIWRDRKDLDPYSEARRANHTNASKLIAQKVNPLLLREYFRKWSKWRDAKSNISTE